MFQFQNGTIKRWAEILRRKRNTQFQFQNGTIKRHFLELQTQWQNKFQFQNGTIKSSLAAAIALYLLSFNSKMVRLKAAFQRKKTLLIMVSIPKWYD